MRLIIVSYIFSILVHDPQNCMYDTLIFQNNLVVLYRGCTVCVVEGWSIVEVIKVNVTNINAGGDAGGRDRKQEREEEGEGGGGTTLPLKYKKWNVKDQTLTNDVALLGKICAVAAVCKTPFHCIMLKFSLSPPLPPSSLPLSLSFFLSFSLLAHTTPSSFDHLCEASNVAGFDATIRSAPVPEAKLITVGENPMIALYKITKVNTCI